MAVYTDVGSEELGRFLDAYDVGRLVSAKGIAEGVENSNFLVITEQGTFILTLYEKRVDPADLPFFLGLMRYLADRGVPCPTPIAARDGQTLRTLCERPAAMVSFLTGVWLRRIEPNHLAALGEALAAMHEAGQGFALTRPNDLSIRGWRRLVTACGARADEVEAGLASELATELAALEAAWPRDLPRGVIHADLFPDNVFFDRERLTGLIDFYFACNDFLAYDLAVCLNAWCFERDLAFNATKARVLLAAYARRRALSPGEIAALPVLARGAALRFLLTRLFDWLNQVQGALVTPKDPREYLHKLRFHRAVRDVGAYGLP
ncbi:MAG: homoserine kinase [Alphaproteobacteria bacterium]|nr:homoserine kinase [Alphaproteobacteria bacterium]